MSDIRRVIPDSSRRILGLDPGLRLTGWGVIDVQGSCLTHIAHGVVKTDTGGDLSSRLASLYRELEAIMLEYRPTEAAIEETFVNCNPLSALKLGAARGVALLVPGRMGLPVGEYAPNKIKKSLVGVGHADKNQIAIMVNYLLPKCGGASKDAADALAVAICHAHHPIESFKRHG